MTVETLLHVSICMGAGVHLELYEPHFHCPSFVTLRQTKQKEVLQLLQVMCLQSLSCSIRIPQPGHARSVGQFLILPIGFFWHVVRYRTRESIHVSQLGLVHWKQKGKQANSNCVFPFSKLSSIFVYFPHLYVDLYFLTLELLILFK